MILAMPLTMNNVSAEGNDEAKPSTSMETTLEELAKHFDYREAVNEATESNVSAYTIRLGMEGDDIWFPEHEWLFFRPSNAKATKLFLRAMSAKAPVKEMLALNIKDGCIKNIGVAFLTNDNKTAEDIFDRAVGNVSYRMPNVMPKDEPTHYERYIKDKNATLVDMREWLLDDHGLAVVRYTSPTPEGGSLFDTPTYDTIVVYRY